MAEKLIGKDIVPPDLVAKVTGRAKFAEDFRAPGMVFAKLLLSPMPHARVRNVDASEALGMPGVLGMLTPDDLPEAPPRSERALTYEPLYQGEPTQYCLFSRCGSVAVPIGLGGPASIDSDRCISD